MNFLCRLLINAVSCNSIEMNTPQVLIGKYAIIVLNISLVQIACVNVWPQHDSWGYTDAKLATLNPLHLVIGIGLEVLINTVAGLKTVLIRKYHNRILMLKSDLANWRFHQEDTLNNIWDYFMFFYLWLQCGLVSFIFKPQSNSKC